MSRARLVITAVIVERRPIAEVAATYGISRSWLNELSGSATADGGDMFWLDDGQRGAMKPMRTAQAARMRKSIMPRRSICAPSMSPPSSTPAREQATRGHPGHRDADR